MEQSDVVRWKGTTLRRSDRTSWQARQAIGLWLADAPAPVRGDALQIIAEFVANVVQHVPGGRRSDWVTVRLGFGGGFVRLQVIDPGTRKSEPNFVPVHMGSVAESGRGLGIVAQLSIRCGTYVMPDGHRVVWADLAVA
ncbi:ATP-binding protein [Nonomuraea sp. NPDC002799]